MKFIILIGIIYLVFRYYNKKAELEKRVEDFPQPREKEKIEDFTDYEELE